MASLKVVVLCVALLASLLAPALARIYIVDDGLPDGAAASGSASGDGVGGSSGGGVQLVEGRQHREPSGGTVSASASNRGRKKYRDTLAETEVRTQQEFEALRTVQKRTREAVDPPAGGAQLSGPERHRRRKPQQPQVEEQPAATGSSDQQPTGGAYSGTGPSGEGVDYDDGEVDQSTPELSRDAPQQPPPTAPDRGLLYPSSVYSSETDRMVAPDSNQKLAVSATASSPYSASLAYSTIGKDSVSDYSERNRNSLQFTPFDSQVNPYVKTVDPIQYAQAPGSTRNQAHTIRSTSVGSDRLENQISSAYDSIHPVSDSPSLADHPMKADNVFSYIHKKYEAQVPAASQQQAYSFQEFNSGQTVVHHSGQSSPSDLQPSTSNVVYNNVVGTGPILRTVAENVDQNEGPDLRKQLPAAGGMFQSSSRLTPRPHFDDGKPSEDSHRLVHTGPVFKFTLDDRMTPPTGYDSTEHSKEANPSEAGVHSGAHVASTKGKSRDFGETAFLKQGGTEEEAKSTLLELVKSQETGLGKVEFANVGSTSFVSMSINNSQGLDGNKGLPSSATVDTAEAFQGNLQETNMGGLVVTSAPALGSKVQRDTERFLSNHASASRTVTGSLKFAPSAPDQTAAASTSAEATANILSPLSDLHQTQKRSNDPFTLTVGANLQTGTDQSAPGGNREARFTFPQSGTSEHHRMVFPDKVAHTAPASHQTSAHGQHSHGHGYRHHTQRRPASNIVYGSPPRPGAGRVQRPWGLARPARGAPHPHPHSQRRPQQGGRPLRLHKLPSAPAARHVAKAADSVPAGSSVALPAPSSPPHVSFVEAGPWGQFRWSVSHDVALKPTFHWR